MDAPVAPALRDSLNLGAQFANVLPFTQVSCRCPDRCCSRRTIQLELARARTVHKAQGATVDRPTVLDLSTTAERRWPGITYTAFSRFRTLDTFALPKPLPADLVKALGAGVVTSGSRREMERLDALASQTTTAYASCFRGARSVAPLHAWAHSLGRARAQAAAGPAAAS
eukprot:2910295-Rhodomonas_salina.1